jgi:uncharacterized protein (DUF4213/DUF364 family)
LTIADDYLGIIARIAESVVLPPIRKIHVAPHQEDPGKTSKFGAMVLDDDTVGLTYVDLNDARRDLQSRSERHELVGCSPIEAARLYAGEAGWQRSLGMAAINAISQHVLKRSRYALTESANTKGLLEIDPGDHVGMVGYFPPLVDQMRTMRVPLTVIELDKKWLQQDNGIEVTLDPTRLSRCNKIICTGTILVNQTLDAVLSHSKGAEAIYLVGPTVGCLPDPLFKRGVTAAGGRQVVDCNQFIKLWRTGQPWRGATRRYTIAAEEYPGFETLLRKI